MCSVSIQACECAKAILAAETFCSVCILLEIDLENNYYRETKRKRFSMIHTVKYHLSGRSACLSKFFASVCLYLMSELPA